MRKLIAALLLLSCGPAAEDFTETDRAELRKPAKTLRVSANGGATFATSFNAATVYDLTFVLSGAASATFEVYLPGGYLYAVLTGPGAASMPLAGTDAARLPGKWTVKAGGLTSTFVIF